MTTVPLVDLKAQYQTIKHEILPAIERVLDGMALYLGPEQLAFEQEFATYCETRHGVSVSNGTDALALALRACEIGPGDEVITVANTFIATVEAISMVGATPVFVDIDPDTYAMDWRAIERVITPRTRAIMPVHLYGHPAEMEPILEIARRRRLRVIEDSSQAHGATYNGRPIGGLGDIGCFSLYCSKTLGAYGEAGICITNDDDLAERMRVLRDHGSRERYVHEIMGVNARMDELQAAVLRVKLPYLDRWNSARREHADAYTQRLRDVVKTPVTRAWATHAFYVYVIETPERDRVRAELAEQGISTGVHYPIPLHLQPACAQYGIAAGSLPVTEAAAERILSLPMYAELTDEQIMYVSEAISRSLSLVGVRG
ncbi:MAG TPA: DegT/DnrJ/EryC1/StrS family aminotransferase [Ktedonobacterales bacterium]|nr:DegT/DnrJ/EryC1/StrS family aminotransferase [Ktedonobacterales bacterium]